MKLDDILQGIEYNPDEPVTEDITHITTDPEECSRGSLLILTNGRRALPSEEILSSAAGVIYDGVEELPTGAIHIRVKSARAAAAYAYSNYYGIDYSRLKIIGITGTNGKTTTASLLYGILTDLGYSTGFIGTGNIMINGERISDGFYSMTTPDPSLLYKTLKQMELSGCSHVVMEVSSHSLALQKTAPIIFEYGIFTNLSPEHLDFHGSVEEYYKTKLTLFSRCRCAIFNADDPYCRRAYYETDKRKLSVGALFRLGAYASGIIDKGFLGVEFLFCDKKFKFKQKLSLCGVYNVYNAMLAIACSTDMGISPKDVKRSLQEAKPPKGRYEIIKDEITVIIDYAHTDTAMESFLRCAGSAKGRGALVAVFGAGGERDKEKRPRMAKVAEELADRIILTSDNPRKESPLDIINDVKAGFTKDDFTVIEDRRAAIIYAIKSARVADTVAIIGKGAEEYNIDSEGYHHFDEREIIREALTERKKDKNEKKT